LRREGKALVNFSFTHPVYLGRMISLNALAAFTQEIAANVGIVPVRSPTQPVDAGGMAGQKQPAQRALEKVPPAPANPMPRGSLLDLRV